MPRALYEDHALCFEIVASDTRILHALHMDDMVEVEVMRADFGTGPEAMFTIIAYVTRHGGRLKAVTSTMNVVLRALTEATTSALPPSLETIVTTCIRRDEQQTAVAPTIAGRAMSADCGTEAFAAAVGAGILSANANAFVWRWRIPYFYCYYNARLRHSGYLRLMEEIVDLFLAERGISIKTMVDTKRLIPVVPHAAVSMVGEAYMEENILTVFKVDEIFKGFTYKATMDCWVERNRRLVLVQRGSITHGYAEIMNRRDWRLVPFDRQTLAAIENRAV
jgi:acyl-CoA thioesterase FadM